MKINKVLQILQPFEVSAYLRANGWKREADVKGGSVWLWCNERGEQAEILLPKNKTLHDFSVRMLDVLKTIEIVERRSQNEILADIAMINTKRQSIELFEVYRDVRCLRCGNRGAVKYFGSYLPDGNLFTRKRNITKAVDIGEVVPLECLNCGNIGLIDMSLEGYKPTFVNC